MDQVSNGSWKNSVYGRRRPSDEVRSFQNIVNSTLNSELQDNDVPQSTEMSQVVASTSIRLFPNNASSPNAYVFMIWGCDPGERSDTNPPNYAKYIANILVAAKILRIHGSTADIVAIFKLKFSSQHDKLWDEEERIMSLMGIQVRYLPPSQEADDLSEYHAMLEKFKVLNMTEYQRVLYLDSDILPLTNLDYIFESSRGPDAILKENMVLATYSEPSNGGFFMVQPNATAYELANRAIQARLRKDFVFNHTKGWGHVIQSPDEWETNRRNNRGTIWKFVSISVRDCESSSFIWHPIANHSFCLSLLQTTTKGFSITIQSICKRVSPRY